MDKERFFAVLLTLAFLSACARNEPNALVSIKEVPNKIPMDSGQPNLSVGPKGDVYLSWMETTDEGSNVLKFATRTSDGWSEPLTILKNDNLLPNWADFPSLFELPDGVLVAHWPMLIPDSEGYKVELALSKDKGKTWSAPIQPHRDTTKTEHGFVSLSPVSDGVGVIWLDSRKLEAGSDEVSLMYTRVGGDGTLSDELEIDERVCECCQPSSIDVPGGLLAVYRDRTKDEIRDIAITRFDGKQWSAPKIVSDDHWQISACPIQGPAISAAGDTIAVAWFTAADDKPRVNVALSRDGGEKFSKPTQLNMNEPVGRVDVVALDSGGAVVTWIENTGAGAEVKARQVDAAGKPGEPVTVGKTSAATRSGFPRVEKSGDSIVFVWTDLDERRIRTAATGQQ